MAFRSSEIFLDKVVSELKSKYRCHTVLLYGSRARGDASNMSDYDLMGVRKNGCKLRLVEKRNGKYLDIFIFPEKELKKIGEAHVYMHGAVVLFQKKKYGTDFVKRLDSFLEKPYKPLPKDEIMALKVWAQKMLERIKLGDVEANYRRVWLQEALLADYFQIRKKRYLGSKKSFLWLKENDPKSYRLFEKVLANPKNFELLRKLVKRVIKG